MHHPTLIIRHRRENLKKCSLRGLETRSDMQFYTYPSGTPQLKIEPSSYIFLTMQAPPLTSDDAQYGLLLVDATWRLAQKMTAQLPQLTKLQGRSLPAHFRTAYPRRQEDCLDPQKGLASVEALYLAYHILGHSTEGLLDHYHWKDDFLNFNQLT